MTRFELNLKKEKRSRGLVSFPKIVIVAMESVAKMLTLDGLDEVKFKSCIILFGR